MPKSSYTSNEIKELKELLEEIIADTIYGYNDYGYDYDECERRAKEEAEAFLIKKQII